MSLISHSRDRIESLADPLALLRLEAANLSFPPRGTVRCIGQPLFRSQAARDLACLLDIDPTIVSWTCLPFMMENDGADLHVPDFAVTRADGVTLHDVGEEGSTALPDWVADAAHDGGYRYERVQAAELRDGFRLENARDLLRYANFHAPLGDRVRLLALMDEYGPMPLANCMQVVRTGADPIAVIAALVLRRFLELDLDEARIGPDTRLARFRG